MIEHHASNADGTVAELQGFEDLFEKFQSTSESLERSYSALQERVRRLSGELQTEREHRIELERMAAMGEMSMELAHEIRNPLGSIELYASMIEGPYAEQIVRGVRLLNHSVTNVLQFGQPICPRVTDFGAGELVDGVRTFLAPLAAEKDIVIGSEVEPGCALRGDFELLHRMLLNLVLNALREVSRGGRIVLGARNEDGTVAILVEDDGPGMPPEVLTRIFDPMFSTNRSGCGLGLSIVKRIVDSHGGTIQVESNADGTRFEIRVAGTADSPRAHAESAGGVH